MLWRKIKQGRGIKNVGMEVRRCQLNTEGSTFPEEIEEVGVRILGRFILVY